MYIRGLMERAVRGSSEASGLAPVKSTCCFRCSRSSVRATHQVFAGDPGNKEKEHAEEATQSAVRIGTSLTAGDSGVRAGSCQDQGSPLGRSSGKKQQRAV